MPPSPAWQFRQSALSPAQVRFREQLGVDPARAVVMSGHQAEVWHPGIAAKWFAMRAVAQATGAQAVWVVVDQDANDPTRIAYPTADLRRRTLGAASHTRPTGTQPPHPPPGMPDDCAEPAREGLSRLLAALASHTGAGTLAQQHTLAVRDLLGPLADGVTTIYATDLARTDLFRGFADSLRSEKAITDAYNRSIAATGRAGGTRPLGEDPERGRELPLWRLHPSGARLAVFSQDPPAVLAPKALLLTALYRIAGCDLFIHGLGGGVYDRVTDHWLALLRRQGSLSALVGASPARTAPTCVVTATRFLPLASAPLPTPEAVAYTAWLAHRARFDPLVVGDRAGAAAKAVLLHAVQTAPSREARLHAYRELHAALDAHRVAHADSITHLDALAATARTARGAAAVRFDRTWPFPLYGSGAIHALAEEVGARARLQLLPPAR